MSDVTGVGHRLDVHIVTPEREVWAGRARFLLARTAAGDMGVLGGHEHTLAVLGAGPLEVETTEGTRSWGVEGGFLSVGGHGEVTRVDVLAERVSEDVSAVVPVSQPVTQETLDQRDS